MDYVYGVATFVMSILTVIGNLMIIAAFVVERNLRTRPSNLLVMSLSVADLLFGSYLFVYYGLPITFGLGHPFGEIGCMMSVFPEYSYIVGTLLLISISVDRVFLVSLDYSRYMRFQSASRVKVTIITCCLIGVAGASVEVGMWNFAKRINEAAAGIDFDLYCLYPQRRMKTFALYLATTFYVLPVLLIGILSSTFFCLLRRRIRKTVQIGSSVNGYQTQSARLESQTTGSRDPANQEEASRSTRTNRYKKPAITLAALVTAMLISMFPYCIYLIVAVARPQINDPGLIYIMILICQFNPLLNPIFYGATQHQIRDLYRKQARKIFVRISRCVHETLEDGT